MGRDNENGRGFEGTSTTSCGERKTLKSGTVTKGNAIFN
jgi:hypothetical protein